MAAYEITSVGLTSVPGGHRHITRVGTDNGTRGWEINQVLARLAVGDRFYMEGVEGERTPAFSEVCACGFETIRTVDGGYLGVDYLDALSEV